MGKAIEQLKSGLTVGHVKLGFRGGVTGSICHQVHDGDTINVHAIGNFGIRFLGVDAPEISYTLPNEKRFTVLSNSRWETFLSNPFSDNLPPFNPPLTQGLLGHLQASTGPGTAQNHYLHAEAAEDSLEEEVVKDLEALGQSEEDFQFFLVFAHEVMDGYGRFLCYINRNQLHPTTPEPRPDTYNERLLKNGRVSPYFIWPNLNPFRKKGSLAEAVIPPGKANEIAEGDKTLSKSRQWVRNARNQKIGIFNSGDPLRLQPFEVRFLSRRRPPNRWVIDLGKNDSTLIKPQNYYTIANVEDRLYVPEEDVPLFVGAGWQREE